MDSISPLVDAGRSRRLIEACVATGVHQCEGITGIPAGSRTFVNPGGPAVRAFDSFSQPLAEIIEARIWAGLHYRSSDIEGQRLGRNVANYAAANYFQPVGH